MLVKHKTDVRDSIMEYLKGEDVERSLRWLARKIEVNYATIYSCFVQKTFSLSQENLDKINKVLETDFELS